MSMGGLGIVEERPGDSFYTRRKSLSEPQLCRDGQTAGDVLAGVEQVAYTRSLTARIGLKPLN